MLDSVVNNVDLGLFHARMMTLMRSTFPQTAIDLILRPLLPNGFQSRYLAPTADNVGVYYGGDNNRKIMYLDGVVNSQQAFGLVGGYSKFLGLQILTTLNAWVRDRLPIYYGVMSGGHMQAPEYIDFVGYSAGGVVAQSLAWDQRRLQSVAKTKVITYGGPRVGAAAVRDQSTRIATARYMTAADPIPLIPPRLQDAPALVVALPVGVTLSWSNMVHTHGGVALYPDGTMTEAVVSPEAAINPGTSLSDWYFSVEGDPNNPHAMQSYVASLLAATNARRTPREKQVDLAGGEDDDETDRRQVNQARERTAKKIAQVQRQQNAVIVNHPAIVLFKPTRFGRVWCVVFGDKIVAQGVREDTCRHICRVGNDFLRSLPKQGLVDPIALAQQMEQFLVFASSPESEWRPTLRTNLES